MMALSLLTRTSLAALPVDRYGIIVLGLIRLELYRLSQQIQEAIFFSLRSHAVMNKHACMTKMLGPPKHEAHNLKINHRPQALAIRHHRRHLAVLHFYSLWPAHVPKPNLNMHGGAL